MRRLLVIDGLNLARRIWEAIPIEDSPEKAVGALRSCLSSFARSLKEHAPTHVLAAFDYGGETWRHRRYPAYHEGREPMPTSMRETLPTLMEHVRGLGIRTVSVPDVEADDVIATVVRRWLSQVKGEAIVLSSDKDLAALIAEGARVHNHFKSEDRDTEWVENKFGVRPSQLHDLLALTGDSSDNIPGVPGIGVKTGAKLLAAYGSLDAVLEQARIEGEPDNRVLSSRLRQSLRDHERTARLARELIDFKMDLSLGLTWNSMRYQPPVARAEPSATVAFEPSL